MIKVGALFHVESGDFHAYAAELEPGGVPLVSCGNTDNGVVGYFDIPESKRYERALTVAYNGSWPIMTKFHPYEFGAKDDVAVLRPKLPMSTLALLYAAALLNKMIWRYSYGRKCFREKLSDVDLSFPVVKTDAGLQVDEAKIARVCPSGLSGISNNILGEAQAQFSALVDDKPPADPMRHTGPRVVTSGGALVPTTDPDEVARRMLATLPQKKRAKK